MRDIHYTPNDLAEQAGVTKRGGRAMRKLLRWVSENMVRLVDDCPECGACVDEGDEHAPSCPNHPVWSP